MKKTIFRTLALMLMLLLALSAFVACGEKQDPNEPMDLSSLKLSRYIKLGDYTSLPFELEVKRVTDADVERAIEEFKAGLSSYEEYGEPVSRVTEDYDYLSISYVGRVDGEVVDTAPPESPQYLLLVDGNGYYDWINAALRGICVGDTVFAEGQLAEQEGYGEYAGKTIVYEIKLQAILGHYTFVEMTDEVVEEKTGYASVEEYRAALYTLLDEARKEAALATIYQKIWDTAVENAKVRKYPRHQVEYYYNAFYGNYAYIAYQKNLPVEMVLAQHGLDEKGIRDMAEQSTREELFYYAFVQENGLEVTDEEYAARVGGIATGQGVSVEVLEAEHGKEDIRDSMLFDEAIVFLANIVDVNYIYVD